MEHWGRESGLLWPEVKAERGCLKDGAKTGMKRWQMHDMPFLPPLINQCIQLYSSD